MEPDLPETSVRAVNDDSFLTDAIHSRRLLAVCRRLLTRQRAVFDHALANGAESVPFNTQRVAWATNTKLGLMRKRRKSH